VGGGGQEPPLAQVWVFGIVDVCAPMEYLMGMYTFIESSIFERELPIYLDDEEYAELQSFLMEHPESGDVVPGTGGVRKLRWKRSGTGKRGGLRLIYYVRHKPDEIWLFAIYSKARRESIPAHVLKAFKEGFIDES
jgi:mRNA-degrading endonuclease RelE of RelBE toxin-antitoxin system